MRGRKDLEKTLITPNFYTVLHKCRALFREWNPCNSEAEEVGAIITVYREENRGVGRSRDLSGVTQLVKKQSLELGTPPPGHSKLQE